MDCYQEPAKTLKHPILVCTQETKLVIWNDKNGKKGLGEDISQQQRKQAWDSRAHACE